MNMPVFVAPELLNQTTAISMNELEWNSRHDLGFYLDGFQGRSLQMVSKATLMNRVDTKYLIPLAFIPTLLTLLQADYDILEIAGRRMFTYKNLYFDTADFRFYAAHHNGKLNRYKVRHRRYEETHSDFLEVKFKNNHRRTVKTRLAIHAEMGKITKEMSEFLHAHGIHEPLYPKQLEQYQRVTLVNEALGERITLDFGLSYQQQNGQWQQLQEVFIAELKQASKTMPSPFTTLMREYHLKPNSFSKYCIGCCLTHPNVLKTNNFKPTLLKLQQLRATIS